MTTVADEISSAVRDILAASWNEREGQVVPTTDDVVLKNGAVSLDAVFLYGDLHRSTALAEIATRKQAAKVIRAYLSSMSRVIKVRGGEIRSFDGDRVMAIFVGDGKNSAAAKCALQMNYVLTKILRPKIESAYPSLKGSGFTVAHAVGVESGSVLIVRAGVRGSNDLVAVGPAPNLAAKLSDLRTGYSSYISSSVHGRLNEESKFGGNPKRAMWTKTSQKVNDADTVVYASNWHWTP